MDDQDDSKSTVCFPYFVRLNKNICFNCKIFFIQNTRIKFSRVASLFTFYCLYLLQCVIYFIAGTSSYSNTTDLVKSKDQVWIQTHIQRINKFACHYNRLCASFPIKMKKKQHCFFRAQFGKVESKLPHDFKIQNRQQIHLHHMITVNFNFYFFTKQIHVVGLYCLRNTATVPFHSIVSRVCPE